MTTLDKDDLRRFISDQVLAFHQARLVRLQSLVHGSLFARQRSEIERRFAGEFEKQFCDPGGLINWRRLVEFNSGAR